MPAPLQSGVRPSLEMPFMLSTIFAALSFAFALLGFLGGIGLVGAVNALRARPRYLMLGGAAALLLGIAIGHGLVAQSLLYFPALFSMMAGVGMLLAGWESEKEWQEDRSQVHQLRMAQIHRQLVDRRAADVPGNAAITVKPVLQVDDTERRGPSAPEEPAR